jgi:anion-transporting  ArsA/GET3 family ATPase
MALERLYEIDRGGRYDLVVVDTPPAAHARDLLDSPYRMLRFIEGKSLKWLLKPGMKMGRFGLKAIGGSSGPVMGLLERITGAQVIRDTTEFFEAFEGMYDGWSERIRIVERMFSDEHTGFVIVTSPERESIDEAGEFFDRLATEQCNFLGSIVNRVEPTQVGASVTAADLVALDGIDEDLASRILEAHAEHARIAARDEERVEELARLTSGAPTIRVPRLPRLITDLDGLRQLTPYLYAPPATEH